MDCSPLGFSVHGIFQARILEWLPFPSLGDLPDPGIEPGSAALQADSLSTELPGKPIVLSVEIPNILGILKKSFIIIMKIISFIDFFYSFEENIYFLK